MGDSRSAARVDDEFLADASSIGALHGSARGNRNVQGRLEAMRRLADLSGESLLDVGCGTGEYTVELARSFGRVEAVDIEQERLELFAARAPVNVRVRSMSVNDLDFADGSFDIVTMIEVLEHLNDPSGGLAEIARVLKPGGRLVLTTPNRLWPIEQHGALVRGRRVRSVYFPGLVWVKPLHRRMSDAGAFTESDLECLAGGTGLELTGVTFMMPPLDSLGDGHRIHRLLDRLERTPARRFGQTIVGCFTKS